MDGQMPGNGHFQALESLDAQPDPNFPPLLVREGWVFLRASSTGADAAFLMGIPIALKSVEAMSRA